MANNATTVSGRGSTEVSFTVGGKYRMVGHDQRARARRQGPNLDRSVRSSATCSSKRRTPATRTLAASTFPVADRSDAGRVSVTRLDDLRSHGQPDVRRAGPRQRSQRTPSGGRHGDGGTSLLTGVFYLTGTTHHSLVVEMRDHIVVVDPPNTEERARAVLAKAKELIPNKPIRYVVTSHHHWDHLGGIRTAIDEGATIVTHQSNKAFLERVAKTPHTLGPDRLAASKKSPQDPDRRRPWSADRRHADDRATPASELRAHRRHDHGVFAD